MKRFFAITAALAGVIALACAVLRRNGALQQPGRSGVELEVRTPYSVTVAGRDTVSYTHLDVYKRQTNHSFHGQIEIKAFYSAFS